MRQVSRSFPRDVIDTPWAVLREMLLPRRLLDPARREEERLLRGIDLTLASDEGLGILGARRSGKSTLAAIAAGVLAPTAGEVEGAGTRLLLSRPTAGFKPGLTLAENLGLRALLHGLEAGAQEAAVARSFARCSVPPSLAREATGNLCPALVKQLALVMLLDLPAQVLVVDEWPSAGVGPARRRTRALLEERLEARAFLLLSSDPQTLRGRVRRACVLRDGRLEGPFDLAEAIERHADQRDDLDDPHGMRVDPDLQDENVAEDEEDESAGEMAVRAPGPGPDPAFARWELAQLEVDAEVVHRSSQCLLRTPGAQLHVRLSLRALCRQVFTGGLFELYGGSSGLRIAHACHEIPAQEVGPQDLLAVDFDVVIPEAGELFYGLAFCPLLEGRQVSGTHRMKLVLVGSGGIATPPRPFVTVRAVAREEAIRDGVHQWP